MTPTPLTTAPSTTNLRAKAAAILALMGLTLAATASPVPTTPATTPAPAAPSTQDEPAPSGFPGNAKATLSLFAKHAALAPNIPATLGIKIIHEPHWHTYFPAANDSGVPTTVVVDLITDQAGKDISGHIDVGPLTFPAPVRYINEGEILDHVLEGDATLLLPVTVKPTLGSDVKSVIFDLTVDFLICKETCLPGRKSLRLTMPIDPVKAKLIDDTTELAFRMTEARLPKVLTPEIAKAEGISVAWQPSTSVGGVGGGGGTSPTLVISTSPRPRTAAKLEFYPLEDSPRPENLVAGGTGIETLTLIFSAPKAVNNPPTSPVTIKGILMVQPMSKPSTHGGRDASSPTETTPDKTPSGNPASRETENRANHTAMRLAGPNFYLIETTVPTPAKTPSESGTK